MLLSLLFALFLFLAPRVPAGAAAAAAARRAVELYLIPHTHADVGWLQTLDSLSRVNAYSCGNSEESKLTQRLQHLRVLVDDPLKPPIRRNGGQHALLQKAPLVHTQNSRAPIAVAITTNVLHRRPQQLIAQLAQPRDTGLPAVLGEESRVHLDPLFIFLGRIHGHCSDNLMFEVRSGLEPLLRCVPPLVKVASGRAK